MLAPAARGKPQDVALGSGLVAVLLQPCSRPCCLPGSAARLHQPLRNWPISTFTHSHAAISSFPALQPLAQSSLSCPSSEHQRATAYTPQHYPMRASFVNSPVKLTRTPHRKTGVGGISTAILPAHGATSAPFNLLEQPWHLAYWASSEALRRSTLESNPLDNGRLAAGPI